MQDGIHPKGRLVKFIMPDGKYIECYSTYSKSDEFYCEKSIWNHRAWTKETDNNEGSSSAHANKMFDKFSGMNDIQDYI